MAKALVICHANCDDGFGAAFAFWKFEAYHYDSTVYWPASYGDPHPTVDEDTEVFVLDFSYPPDIMNLFAMQAKEYTVLDHHKTAKEAWDKWLEDEANEPYGNMHVYFDMSQSGAMLAYKEFSTEWQQCYLEFFEFLQDRDLWQFKNPDTKFFTQYLRSFPQDFIVWDEICEDICVMGPDSYSAIMKAGEALQRRFDQMCAEIIKLGKREVWIDGIKGLECNCPPTFASDIGNLLALESGTFGHTWICLEDYSLHSLRSTGDFDVSAIAKSFGGGGHKNAAGFKISYSAGPEIDRRFETNWYRREVLGIK